MSSRAVIKEKKTTKTKKRRVQKGRRDASIICSCGAEKEGKGRVTHALYCPVKKDMVERARVKKDMVERARVKRLNKKQ